MAVKLTPRMESWLEHLGAHVAVARPGEWPTIVVANACECEEGQVCICLTEKQRWQIEEVVGENDRVAIAPGGLGAVRAPYQFKGRGSLDGNVLKVSVDQIYCTRPGCEAGKRMDVMEYDDMCEYDVTRWKDIDPPGVA
ncbi:MAG: hypothetical protein Kow00129_13790 [Thermoleophilia bacterium]